jgi:hypothetical protein
MQSTILMSVDITTISDMQHFVINPVKWALNSTYHTTLQASPGQLAFRQDMIMPTSYIANRRLIRLQRQQQTNKNTACENKNHIPHRYNVGDQVLLLTDCITRKLAKPTRGPFTITDVTNQHVNGTVTIHRKPNLTETINICHLCPFCAVEDTDAMIVG